MSQALKPASKGGEGVGRGSRSAYEIFCFAGKRTRNNWALNQGNGGKGTANQGKWWKIRS